MSKILIVEDVIEIQQLIETILTREGHQVICAANGKEAFKMLSKDEEVELIFLDIMMPVMGGIEFLRAHSRYCGARNIQICMLTALELNDRVTLCMDLGAQDYLVKPVSKRSLLSKVKALLKNEKLISYPAYKVKLPVVVESDKDLYGAELLYLFEDRAIIEMNLELNENSIFELRAQELDEIFGFNFKVVCKVIQVEHSCSINGYLVDFIGFPEEKAKVIKKLQNLKNERVA